MTEEITINLPKLGESIHSATVVQWFKQVGDTVGIDEPLLEVSTDKVNSEIPSPAAGVIKEILAEVDQELQVGEPLVVIEHREAGAPPQASPTQTTEKPKDSSTGSMEGLFSPSILRMARESGIKTEELEKIPTTGAEGRLTKKDVELYIKNKDSRDTPVPICGKVEHIKITGMRKAIAENITRSYNEIPHAALVCSVDITEALKFVRENREAFLQKEGCKLTVTSCVIKAMAQALKEHPMLNAQVEGDTIVVKHFVNIGVAVSVNEGLMVPVIKNCHEKSLTETAKALADLSTRAREGKLRLEEVREGTVTLSNFGMSGMTMGLPIIRHPEVSIIGMAGIEKKVVVLDGDETAIRSIVNLSLSFDHRVVDGMYGCHLLATLKKNLETTQTL